jgi:uncharacterized iron-regulated membrane protein
MMTDPANRGRTPARRRGAWDLHAVCLVVHRWVGLTIALFLVVAGLTGAALAYNEELDAFFAHDLWRVSEEAAPPALDRAVVAVEAVDAFTDRLPEGATVSTIPLDTPAGHSLRVWVDLPKHSELPDEWFLHPRDGSVVGARRWGDPSEGRRNLMPFIYRLHYSLGLGEVGSLLFGIAALAWTIDCFVAVVLTLPRSSPRAKYRSWRRWFSVWRRAWRIQRRPAAALIHTSHRAFGLWAWALCFVFAWSAVGFNLPGVFEPAMRVAGATPYVPVSVEFAATMQLASSGSESPSLRLSWSDALRLGRREIHREAEERGFRIERERRLSHDPQQHAFRLQVGSSLDVSGRFGATSVWIDDRDGRFLGFRSPTDTTGDRLTQWLYSLHLATVRPFGSAYRHVVAVFGVLVAWLSASGVWMYLRRRDRDARRDRYSAVTTHTARFDAT